MAEQSYHSPQPSPGEEHITALDNHSLDCRFCFAYLHRPHLGISLCPWGKRQFLQALLKQLMARQGLVLEPQVPALEILRRRTELSFSAAQAEPTSEQMRRQA